MSTQKIFDQHLENMEWSKKISFYKDEIKVMQNRLSEVASKNSSKEVLAEIEHFQNQLIIQSNNLDEMKHNINIGEDALAANINHNPTAVDRRTVEDHSKEREDIEGFEKNFNEMRRDFNVFIAKWM